MITWKTREGETLSIDEMDDDHLMNSIRMLERNAPLTEEIVIFQMRLFTIDIIIKRPSIYKVTHPRYPDLLRIAEERGLL